MRKKLLATVMMCFVMMGAKAQRWYEVIENATQALNIDPIGLVFVTRGEAYKALGNYKQALRDYKAGKRDNCPEAATAYNTLKAKMKEMKKKKKKYFQLCGYLLNDSGIKRQKNNKLVTIFKT